MSVLAESYWKSYFGAMTKHAPRFLLAFAALMMAAGAVIHTAAFGRAARVIASANLPPFFAGSFRALWLADSTTMLALGAVCGVVAAKPSAGSRPVVMLIGLVYAALTAFTYGFIGNFFAAHMVLAISGAILIAGWMLPAGRYTA
jgi:hypothetical protein